MIRFSLLMLLAALAPLAFVGCAPPAETGSAVEEAVEEASEAADEAVEAADSAVEEAGSAVGSGLEEAGSILE